MTAPHTEAELDGVTIEFIDEQQGAELLDLRAREWLNMSGAEFARAFCAGELDIETPHVGMLYMMLPLAKLECGARTNPD